MRRISRSFPSVVILVLSVVLWLSVGICAQVTNKSATVQPPFSLTITLAETSVKLGSPIWVEVTRENKSDHTISVYKEASQDMDQGGSVDRVFVRDESGAKVPLTSTGKSLQGPETREERNHNRERVFSGGYFFLPSGKTMTDRVNATRIRDVRRAGKYTVQIEAVDEESKTTVQSNIATVNVTP
jgi:hypothetical protein